MEVSATLKYAHISAQKVRLAANQIRGLPADKAVDILRFSPQKAAHLVGKVLNSAIANAENNNGADVDELRISRVCIDEGPCLKRFRARARGRGDRITKRLCHITVKVADSMGAE